MDAQVNAHLELVQAPQGLALSVYVAAEPPKHLRWRLDMKSRTSGGTNNISQGGHVTEARQTAANAPVGYILISPDSRGSATLIVFDGEKEVASDLVTFGETASDPVRNGRP